jgi:hypothetical protein
VAGEHAVEVDLDLDHQGRPPVADVVHDAEHREHDGGRDPDEGVGERHRHPGEGLGQPVGHRFGDIRHGSGIGRHQVHELADREGQSVERAEEPQHEHEARGGAHEALGQEQAS